jgi:hypothetical protein
MNQTVQYERMGNMGNETRQHKIQNSRGAEKIARKAREILRARNMLAAFAVIMSIAGREAPANANNQATKESASGSMPEVCRALSAKSQSVLAQASLQSRQLTALRFRATSDTII